MRTLAQGTRAFCASDDPVLRPSLGLMVRHAFEVFAKKLSKPNHCPCPPVRDRCCRPCFFTLKIHKFPLRLKKYIEIATNKMNTQISFRTGIKEFVRRRNSRHGRARRRGSLSNPQSGRLWVVSVPEGSADEMGRLECGQLMFRDLFWMLGGG